MKKNILFLILTFNLVNSIMAQGAEEKEINKDIDLILNQRKIVSTIHLELSCNLDFIEVSVKEKLIYIKILNLDSIEMVLDYSCRNLNLFVEEISSTNISIIDKPSACDYYDDKKITIQPNEGIETIIFRSKAIKNKVIRIGLKWKGKVLYSRWFEN